MKLIVESNNTEKFNLLASFLRSNGYKVSINEGIPLSEEAWMFPNNLVSEEEHTKHAIQMENDLDEGTETSLFFKDLMKQIEAWK